MIGTSDGYQYESDFDYSIGNGSKVDTTTLAQNKRTSEAPTGLQTPSVDDIDTSHTSSEAFPEPPTPPSYPFDKKYPDFKNGNPEEDWSDLIEYKGNLIDINKLSPKELKIFDEYQKEKEDYLRIRHGVKTVSDSGMIQLAMVDNPYETPKQSMVDAPGGFGGGGSFKWSRQGNTTKGGQRSVNDNDKAAMEYEGREYLKSLGHDPNDPTDKEYFDNPISWAKAAGWNGKPVGRQIDDPYTDAQIEQSWNSYIKQHGEARVKDLGPSVIPFRTPRDTVQSDRVYNLGKDERASDYNKGKKKDDKVIPILPHLIPEE